MIIFVLCCGKNACWSVQHSVLSGQECYKAFITSRYTFAYLSFTRLLEAPLPMFLGAQTQTLWQSSELWVCVHVTTALVECLKGLWHPQEGRKRDLDPIGALGKVLYLPWFSLWPLSESRKCLIFFISISLIYAHFRPNKNSNQIKLLSAELCPGDPGQFPFAMQVNQFTRRSYDNGEWSTSLLCPWRN